MSSLFNQESNQENDILIKLTSRQYSPIPNSPEASHKRGASTVILSRLQFGIPAPPMEQHHGKEDAGTGDEF